MASIFHKSTHYKQNKIQSQHSLLSICNKIVCLLFSFFCFFWGEGGGGQAYVGMYYHICHILSFPTSYIYLDMHHQRWNKCYPLQMLVVKWIDVFYFLKMCVHLINKDCNIYHFPTFNMLISFKCALYFCFEVLKHPFLIILTTFIN